MFKTTTRGGNLFLLLISIFIIHVVLVLLFEFDIFPGFNFNLILFAVIFVIINLLLYSIKKEYFFKLSVFFSKKIIISIIFLYILMLIVTSISTIHIISKLKENVEFKNNFPTSKLNYDYKNFLTLRNVVIVQSSIDYKLNNELEKKIEILKQLNISMELHFKKERNDKEFLIMVAHYPDYIYRESTKLFFGLVLYLYLFVTYWLLANYLQKDAKVKQTIGVFVLVFPIHFVFLFSSGQIANGLLPSIYKSNKPPILKALINEYDVFGNRMKDFDYSKSKIKEHGSRPIGINNLYIKITSRSKR